MRKLLKSNKYCDTFF